MLRHTVTLFVALSWALPTFAQSVSPISRVGGDVHWKAPVASFAALPALGNSVGDTRIEKTAFGIFTWTGVAWQSGSGGISTTLASSKIIIGNASNVATAVSMSGDTTIDNVGDVTVVTVGASSAANVHAAELLANAATAVNTASTIMKRDGLGQVAATTFTGALSGNASTATALASVPTACASNTFSNAIAANGNLTCTSIPNAATTATSASTNSTIVARDGSGNFSAGTITAALTGNASTATALASNPSDCSANNFATTIAANGDLTCAQPTVSNLAALTVSKMVETTSGGILTTSSFAPATAANTASAGMARDVSGQVAATTFTGALVGNADTATVSTTSATTTKSDNVSYFPTFVSNNSTSSQAIKVGSMSYNPSTNTLTATTFSGNATSCTTASAVTTNANLTGPVTSVGNATTITASSVTNAMQANMAASTIKGNNTGSPAAPIDLTVAQLKTLLAMAFTDITGIATVAQTTVTTQALTTCTTARTIDFSTGSTFTLTLTSGNACTLTFSNAASGQTIVIWLTNGSAGGTATVVWPSVLTTSGSAPVMTTGTAALDICTVNYNGSVYGLSCLQGMH